MVIATIAKKYGHRAFECRSKPMWTPNQPTRRNNYAHNYNWDSIQGKVVTIVKNMAMYLRTA